LAAAALAKFHPDRQRGLELGAQLEAEEKFKLLRASYEAYCSAQGGGGGGGQRSPGGSSPGGGGGGGVSRAFPSWTWVLSG
jgi:DnaJ-class molecular chaperone